MTNGDGFRAGTFDRIDEIVRAAVADGQAPGVVAAVGRGRSDTGHVAVAGVMAVGGPPMRADTLFRISSITKPMTAAVVLSLIDDGAVALNEPAERLLPELAERFVLRHPDAPSTTYSPRAGRSPSVTC